FKIVGMEERPSNSIGQSTEQRLHTIPINEDGNEQNCITDYLFFLNGEEISVNNRTYIINGKLTEFKSIHDTPKYYKEEEAPDGIIYIYHAKTGDAPGLVVKRKDYEDWVYEWQGIFRRGSGAERLFVEKILE